MGSIGFGVALGLLAATAGAPAAAPGVAPPDHAAYDALLAKYVARDGVRYAAWHAAGADRAALEAYLARLQEVDPSALADSAGGGRDAALAYWINLYNAATLDLVLDGYPVRSIRDLGGDAGSPWRRTVVTVAGRSLSLDAIENDVIRPGFAEPRIHFALNCAARSCPPLRAEAYVPKRLDAQLEAQTRAFLADAARNRLEGDALVLSRIFDWYATDFERAAGSVPAWVRPYLPALAALPPGAAPAIRHADYDWSLNEAGGP